MKQKVRRFVETARVKGIPYTLLWAGQEHGPGSDQTTADSILIFPKIEDDKKKIIERLNWYLPNINNYSVWVSASEEYNHRSVEEQSNNISINYVTDQYEIYQLARRSSDLLVHDIQSFLHPVTIMNIGNMTVIDPKYQKEYKLNNWIDISQKYYNVHTSFSSHLFSHLESAFADHNRSYIFAPGPSLSNIFDYNIDHSAVKFICNDILLYDEIVEYIRPDVITLADPIFFGPSEYADKIRSAAAEIINMYGAYLIVPDKVTGLLHHKLQNINKNMIGLEVSSMSGKQLPGILNERMDFGPVVPSKMLPIASALTEEIAIIGADGYSDKAPSDDYTDSSVNQYRRNSVSKWHPGKNNASTASEETNRKNNSSFEKWISAGREKDVTYYCITDSNYPVLKQIKSDHKNFASE